MRNGKVGSSALPASAVTYFGAALDQSQETVPTGSPATGYGRVALSDDMNTVDITLSWQNLTAPAAAGHIHCCAFLGGTGPVAIDLDPVPQISGIASGTFDLTQSATYAAGFFNGTGGGTVAGARAAFLAGLMGGQAYFNLHNANWPAGEIRGQVGEVPEPATWALMISGFGLVGGAMRRRVAATVAA